MSFPATYAAKVGRYRETNAVGSRNHCGIDAYHLAQGIDEGTS